MCILSSMKISLKAPKAAFLSRAEISIVTGSMAVKLGAKLCLKLKIPTVKLSLSQGSKVRKGCHFTAAKVEPSHF